MPIWEKLSFKNKVTLSYITSKLKKGRAPDRVENKMTAFEFACPVTGTADGRTYGQRLPGRWFRRMVWLVFLAYLFTKFYLIGWHFLGTSWTEETITERSVLALGLCGKKVWSCWNRRSVACNGLNVDRMIEGSLLILQFKHFLQWIDNFFTLISLNTRIIIWLLKNKQHVIQNKCIKYVIVYVLGVLNT